MADTFAQPNVTAHAEPFVRPPRFWLLVLITGLGTGLAGGCLMRLLRTIEHASFPFSSGDFLDSVAHATPLRRVAMLCAAGLVAGLVGFFLPRLYRSRPVGLTKAIWFRSGRLPFAYTVANGLLSIVIVGMGMSLGREGALKDTGGAIASKLADWFRVGPGDRRLLVACAAGAGMAAAYNIPLGGALFGVEVLLGSLSFSTVLPALATSMIATAASWLLLPNQPTYIVPRYTLQPLDLLWAIVAAPVFGLASILWVRGIAWAETRKPKDWHRLVMPVVVLTLVGVLSIGFPDLLGNGKGLVQRAFVDQISPRLLVSLLVLRFVVTSACLSTGAPGGVFTPTMTFGALLGGSLGKLWSMFVPGADVGVFAAVGSAAVLAVTTQGPVSAIVMVMELTHHIDAIMVPVLLATVMASLAAHRFERRSVYSAPIHAGAGPVTLAPMQVFAAWQTKDYRVVTSATSYALVAQTLLTAPGACFVVNENGELLGRITPRELDREHLAEPLDSVTAADLVQPVEALSASASQREGMAMLDSQAAGPIPVVDAATRCLLGAIQRPAGQATRGR